MRGVNGDGVTILYKDGTKFFLKTTDARIVLTDIQIAADDTYEIETDLDSQLDRLSKRMSLIGTSERYTTDGVSIIDNVTGGSIKETAKNAQYVGFKLVKGEIDQYIDGYDFLDLVNLKFTRMQFRAHKPTKLRYVATSFKHATVKLDSNITIGEAVYLNVTPDIAPRMTE